MLLWTIQPEEVWRILRRDGVYRCNPDKATHLNEDIDFSSAYDWMAAQMEKHIGKRPEGVTYPIWAWHTYNWKHKKPDLRTDWFRGRHGVHTCIEIDVPDEVVLLSDEENLATLVRNSANIVQIHTPIQLPPQMQHRPCLFSLIVLI